MGKRYYVQALAGWFERDHLAGVCIVSHIGSKAAAEREAERLNNAIRGQAEEKRVRQALPPSEQSQAEIPRHELPESESEKYSGSILIDPAQLIGLTTKKLYRNGGHGKRRTKSGCTRILQPITKRTASSS
jgi:hypothetical protein